MTTLLLKLGIWQQVERPARIVGASHWASGTHWTKGLIFSNHRETYEYEAKLSGKATRTGINQGRIVHLDLFKIWCDKNGLSRTPVVRFAGGVWCHYSNLKLDSEFMKTFLRKLERLPKKKRLPIVLPATLYYAQRLINILKKVKNILSGSHLSR